MRGGREEEGVEGEGRERRRVMGKKGGEVVQDRIR